MQSSKELREGDRSLAESWAAYFLQFKTTARIEKEYFKYKGFHITVKPDSNPTTTFGVLAIPLVDYSEGKYSIEENRHNFPICLFVYDTRRKQGYYEWLLEPKQNQLYINGYSGLKQLNEVSFKHIEQQVAEYYDVLV